MTENKAPTLLVIDVCYYEDNTATTAGILFSDWESDDILEIFMVKNTHVAAYKSGQFYERELPCILALMNVVDQQPDIVIIDGYVTLGLEKRDGLGAHLYKALGSTTLVIGVAKNKFSDTPAEMEIYRGKSKHPLFVTSIGIDNTVAKNLILNMHGENRLPTLLKRVDRECRRA